MKNEPFVDELAMAASSAFKAAAVRMGGAMVHRWDWAMVVILALLVWAPRLSGPIDLRYDAGVYYLLGTSLAKGEGYRISSEPGAPEALQYPPLLPAFVALHQWALGTTDPSIVAPWLRSSYAALFVAYSLVVLALAKRYLSPGFGLAATALCLLNMMTIFLSDLLFAELPFAVVSVVFALVAASGLPTSRPWVRETASFALAAAGFLLRTMGVALLAAWVMEALIRRRWRLAVLRAAFALLPIVLWQAHVARVRASDEYRRPAYTYQRAPYQYYNVSYAENVHLIDPFRPELGRINPGALAARLGTNLGSMPAVLGEATTANRKSWQSALERTNRLLGHHLLPVGLAWVPILGFGTLVVAGVVILACRGAWLMVFIILGSLGLVCTTPWPAQFTRYLVPLAPFLTIAAVLALSWVGATLRMREPGWASTLGRVGVASVLALAFIVQAYAARWMFHLHQDDSASRFVPAGSSAGAARFFFHNRAWQAWEEAVAWIEAHASPDAIVATASPHLCYLLTGHHAVLPPMESDPGHARRLLEAVPVSYVIVDELEFVDISRRYALPAMESDPTGWRLTHSIGDTRIYGRTAEQTDPSTM